MNPEPTLLETLRLSTADRHAAIERILALDGDIGLARYKRIIAGFDCFLRVWEPLVAAALCEGWKAWLATRSRRAFLRKDMAALGSELLAPPPELVATLCVDTPEAAWGSMYVLEGSALGGQIIAKRAAEGLGITPDCGGAFFAGWGADTGSRWRAFRQLLESATGAGPEARLRACMGARRTFDGLSEVFSLALHERAPA